MTSLLIKNLPTCLSEAALKEFFMHFGAQEIRLLKGKMRGCAVIKFPDPASAKKAISQLHGLKLLDKTLNADYAKQTDEERSVASAVKKSRKHISSIAANLGINYPSPPYLEYAYPRPNKSIVDNIVNAFYNVPKFYEQVLHLMNKMNLPIPFGPPLPGPPSDETRRRRKRRKVDLSDSESEIESEEDSEKERERKRRKLEEDMKKTKERHELNIQHQITRPLKPTVPSLQIKLQTSQPDESTNRGTLPPLPPSTLITSVEQFPSPPSLHVPPNIQIPYTSGDSTAYQKLVTPSILPVQDQPSRNVISSSELQANRQTTEQIQQNFPKFKNYNRGEPTNKLFVKNIDKSVTEEDLFFIFARYFQTDDEARRDLKIDLFTQGRLKGQAFITFPGVEMATQALDEVHGYVLKGKPLVIEYGKKKEQES